MDLFRREVLEARRLRLEGDVLLSQPRRTQFITIMLVISAIALITWLIFGQYARIEAVRGFLAADGSTSKIMALHPGIVEKLSVKEGQAIDKGDVLAVIDTEQRYEQGQRASSEELAASSMQQKLMLEQSRYTSARSKSERDGLVSSINGVELQKADIDQQIAIQDKLVSSLDSILQRYRPIADRGFVSRVEIDRHEQELLIAQQGLSRLQQQINALNSEERKMRSDLARSLADEAVQASGAKSSAEGYKMQQAQIRATQRYVIAAPHRGTVTAIQTGVGRTTDSLLPLMTLLPADTSVHAEVYAPSKAVGFISPGMEVRLLYDAFPYARFGSYDGVIDSISKISLDPRQIDFPLKIDEPVYRITITLKSQKVRTDGKYIALQPGMTLTANIILERQSFFDWLLEPLRSAKGGA